MIEQLGNFVMAQLENNEPNYFQFSNYQFLNPIHARHNSARSDSRLLIAIASMRRSTNT
jgi:hypothetical protein